MDNFDAITQTCADCGETYKTRYCDVCNDITVPTNSESKVSRTNHQLIAEIDNFFSTLERAFAAGNMTLSELGVYATLLELSFGRMWWGTPASLALGYFERYRTCDITRMLNRLNAKGHISIDKSEAGRWIITIKEAQ
jgi:hypothetical protein